VVEQGLANAQHNLAYCYDRGLGIPKDEAEAVKWYRKAAEQGHPKALEALKRETNADWSIVGLDDAGDLFKLAEQGDVNAQYKLGSMYLNGKGVAEDATEAVKWYRKAAEQGVAIAQFLLGCMYANGEGVAEDATEAVKWYRKAAEQGVAIAQCNLGLMFLNGEGVAEDDAEAVKWFKKAAEQGYLDAQYNLGLMYANGEGVATDNVFAYKWWNLAAARGVENAKKNKSILVERMTREQIAEGQKLSREWTDRRTRP
jgi:uncharacterized protein